MHIIICGAGQVGRSIAQQLARENNTIVMIDQNPMLVAEVNDTLDVRGIVGMASLPSVLERAGAKNADMLIAVTSSDEVNMVACQVAASLFNIPSKVARVRHPDYLDPEWADLYGKGHIAIDVTISPEMAVAEAIIRRLHVPGALDAVPFAGGDVQVLAVKCEVGCPLSNLPLKLVQEKMLRHHLSILGVAQKGKFRLPTATMILSDHDVVYLVVERKNSDKALTLFGHHEQEARRLVILGGGNIGLTVASTLEEEDEPVKVVMVELSRERAEYIAAKLPNTVVVNGSGLDKDILAECDIESAETLVAVTNDDKVNILASLLAKRLGCKRTITLVNNTNYIPMLENLGIDVLVNPRETTVSSMLSHVRQGRINGVYSIMDGAAEIIEAEIHKQSKLAGTVLSNLALPKNVYLGAILRAHQLVIPTATDILHEGDIVLMVSLAESIKQLECIFSSKSGLF
jgi:trk system potassium uptake protein